MSTQRPHRRGALRILEARPRPGQSPWPRRRRPPPAHRAPGPGRAGVDDGDEFFEAILGRAGVRIFVTDTGGDAAIAVVLLLLGALAVSFVACGIGALVSGWYFGARRTATDVILRLAARRLPALAGAWTLVHLVEAGVQRRARPPGPRPHDVVRPDRADHRHGGARAPPRRCAARTQLTKRAFSTVLGHLPARRRPRRRPPLLPERHRRHLTPTSSLPASWAVTTATGIGARLGDACSFVAGVAVLLHLDLRVRLEGLDIQLAADERFPRAP